MTNLRLASFLLFLPLTFTSLACPTRTIAFDGGNGGTSGIGWGAGTTGTAGATGGRGGVGGGLGGAPGGLVGAGGHSTGGGSGSHGGVGGVSSTGTGGTLGTGGSRGPVGYRGAVVRVPKREPVEDGGERRRRRYDELHEHDHRRIELRSCGHSCLGGACSGGICQPLLLGTVPSTRTMPGDSCFGGKVYVFTGAGQTGNQDERVASGREHARYADSR